MSKAENKYVHDHIIDEAATRLKKRASIRIAATFLTALDGSHLYRFEYVPEEVFEEARNIFVECDRFERFIH